MSSMERLSNIRTTKLYDRFLPRPDSVGTVKVIFGECMHLVENKSVESGSAGREVYEDAVGSDLFNVFVWLELQKREYLRSW